MGLAFRVCPAVRVDLDPVVRAARDRVDQAIPAIRVAPAGMNRAGVTVVAMAADTAVMAPADLADTSPVDRAGRPDPAIRGALVGRVDRATPVATTLAVMTPVRQAARVSRAAPVSRLDTTLGRMRVLLLPAQADRRTPADHRWDPTRAGAARQEARTPAAAARREVVIQVVVAIQVAAAREAPATRKRLRLNWF